ncbi:DUF3078 domain-containing protein [Flavobacterium humi]|uniref:DUF3078 domain-containing protein n=1 Tax=Flavobacterium humi TaxID=2562683 RepID=A0A4Z0L7S3_9FLAO|nr:DUF3078 domain-containing protein [Flavobacterium humi]TGD57640.1 DUF3078 domain-containing protein [Flavobacterium humi]
MKKKLLVFALALFFYGLPAFSQTKIITSLPDSTSHWKKENKVGFDISEIAFVNWSAGGVNSVSGLLKGQFTRLYEYKNTKWHNELLFKYGVNKQDGNGIQKTDDALHLNSTFGFRNDTISRWYYSAKFNFNTQFTNGYAYPNRDKAISKLFAPAYVFLGSGAEYVNKEAKLTLYISPLTFKTTFVLDRRLANEGAFGVTKAVYDDTGNIVSLGRKTRTEMGFLFTCNHKDEIFRNIFMENRLVLYSDYINKFGNVDVDWQLQLDLVVNQYVKATIGTHLMYDDDIKAKENIDGVQVTVGPKVQLKQILGVGLEYSF